MQQRVTLPSAGSAGRPEHEQHRHVATSAARLPSSPLLAWLLRLTCFSGHAEQPPRAASPSKAQQAGCQGVTHTQESVTFPRPLSGTQSVTDELNRMSHGHKSDRGLNRIDSLHLLSCPQRHSFSKGSVPYQQQQQQQHGAHDRLNTLLCDRPSDSAHHSSPHHRHARTTSDPTWPAAPPSPSPLHPSPSPSHSRSHSQSPPSHHDIHAAALSHLNVPQPPAGS
ncbi:MAG: hypothetical protein WDW38_010939, partial [Sanguina aurantia]